MKRILVASDLSIRSDRAVGRAVSLAARQNAGLTALHVVDSAMPADLAETVKEGAKVKLERFIASRRGSENIEVEILSVIGDPVQAIHDALRKTGADLLVLGVHRDRAFFDAIRETTMERLVRTSTKPVLLVQDASDHDYAKVLAAVDMSEASGRAIGFAHKVAPSAEFSLFHALHIPFKGLTGDANSAASMQPYVSEAEAMIDKWISSATLPESMPRPAVIEGSVSATLDNKMFQFRPDLLVLGGHSRSGLVQRFMGSFATALLRDPPCDLLISC